MDAKLSADVVLFVLFAVKIHDTNSVKVKPKEK
jgi:hypothetical protein